MTLTSFLRCCIGIPFLRVSIEGYCFKKTRNRCFINIIKHYFFLVNNYTWIPFVNASKILDPIWFFKHVWSLFAFKIKATFKSKIILHTDNSNFQMFYNCNNKYRRSLNHMLIWPTMFRLSIAIQSDPLFYITYLISLILI